MSTGRIALFLTVVLSVWTAMNAYVCWRACSIPWTTVHVSRRTCILVFIVLWAAFPLARILEPHHMQSVSRFLELVGATWIGVLFLLFCTFLVVEIVTAGGLLLRNTLPVLRGWAGLTALALSVVALVQGLRPPVITDYQVLLSQLPPEHDGLVLVAISDLHLGNVTGKRRLKRIVQRVNSLQPDLVVLVGDIFDKADEQTEKEIVPVLGAIRAPLGVWAVTGNHEFYAGLDRCVKLLEAAGCNVLRDRWAEVLPGLVIAGVDDLTARGQFGQGDQPISKALANRPPGATILLSHTPWETDTAAAAGANLMLSAHTHNGQLWPFNYFVRLRYPLLTGHYKIDGMHLIVCRGTGTWGPPMRLWLPSEIVRIRLQAK